MQFQSLSTIIMDRVKQNIKSNLSSMNLRFDGRKILMALPYRLDVDISMNKQLKWPQKTYHQLQTLLYSFLCKSKLKGVLCLYKNK